MQHRQDFLPPTIHKATRTSYHSYVVMLYAAGKEHLLPKEFRDSIPFSTQSAWRNVNAEKFYGYQYVNDFLEENIKQKELFERYRNLRRFQNATSRIYIQISDDLELFKRGFYRIKKTRKKIVDAIESVRDVVPVEKLVPLFKISVSTYKSWLSEVRYSCDNSPLKRCRKWYSKQLTQAEVKCIERMLTCKEFMYWPVYSVSRYAAKQGILAACPQTWHKYKKLLGLERKKIKKKKYPESIRATRPDEVWHSDITLYRTGDKVLNYIYIVMDNFSRKILAWLVAGKRDMKYQKQVLKIAYDNAIKKDPDFKVDLIVDGGSEHHNVVINDFLKGVPEHITQKTALKDVDYSNSMIEALNKIMKYQYIFPFDKTLGNSEILIVHLQYSIPDYNDVRPHYAKKGLTPSESHAGVPPIDFTAIMKLAALKRVEENKNKASLCGLCCDGSSGEGLKDVSKSIG